MTRITSETKTLQSRSERLQQLIFRLPSCLVAPNCFRRRTSHVLNSIIWFSVTLERLLVKMGFFVFCFEKVVNKNSTELYLTAAQNIYNSSFSMEHGLAIGWSYRCFIVVGCLRIDTHHHPHFPLTIKIILEQMGHFWVSIWHNLIKQKGKICTVVKV